MWEDTIKNMTTKESHEQYFKQIAVQVAPWVLEDPEFMQVLLSKEALQTFGEPLDGRGILGIDPLDLHFDHELPPSHSAKCRDVPQEIVPIIEAHLHGSWTKDCSHGHPDRGTRVQLLSQRRRPFPSSE